MAEAEEKKEPQVAKKKGVSGIVGLLLPAVLAAGGAFGAAKLAVPGHAPEAGSAEVKPPKPPGPTLTLEPFLVTLPDAQKKSHPVRVTMAIECSSTATDEVTKTFVPRIRDAILGHLRTLPFEDAIDSAKGEKMRTDLLEKLRSVQITFAERVLITDLVAQ